MNPLCSCGKPVDGRTLCTDCTTALKDHLTALAALLGPLQEHALGMAHMGDDVPVRSNEKRLPFNAKASALLGEVEALALKAVDRFNTTVAYIGRRHSSAALWHLVRHVERVALAPWSADLLKQAEDLHRRVEKAVDRPAPKVFCGECGQCAHVLLAEMKDAMVTCPRCGSSYDVQQCRDELLARSADALVTAHEAALALNISPERVRMWAYRRRLVLHGHRDKSPVYRLQDARDLLSEQTRKISA